MAVKNKTQRIKQSKRIKHKQSKRIKRKQSKHIKHKQSKRKKHKQSKLDRKQSGGLLPFSDFKNGTYNFFQNVGNQWTGKPMVTGYRSHKQHLLQT